MKKFLATLLAVMMVVSLVTAAPVLAEDESIEKVNLLVNGDFEATGDELDSTEITGWTNTSEENPFVLVANGAGKAVMALNDSNGDQSGTDMPETQMSQTITIDTQADWYKNYMDWTFELSYDGYNASRSTGATFYITFVNADDEISTMTYADGDAGENYWAWSNRYFSLDTQKKNMSAKPIKSITVEVHAGTARWNRTTLDNIVLSAVYAPMGEGDMANNLLINGNFEAEGDEVDSTEITGWTNLNPENEYFLIEHEGGKAIKALNDSNGDQSGEDLPNAELEQTVTIDKNAEWYTDYENWGFVISADGANQGRHPLASIVVTFTYASGETLEKEYLPVDNGNGYWAWDNRSYDLTEQSRSVVKPVTAITVKFNSRWRWYWSAFDNVSLNPVYLPVVKDEGIDINGNFERIDEEGALECWTFFNTLQASALITEDAYGSREGENYILFTGIENEVAMLEYAAQPGATYLFEVYYKSDTANAAKIQIYDHRERVASYQTTKPEASELWKKASIITTVPATDVDPVIRIQIGNMIPEATVMFDSAKLFLLDTKDYNNLFANSTFELNTAKGTEGENIANWVGGNAVKLVTDFAHSGKNALAVRQGNNAKVGVVMYDRSEEDLKNAETYNLGVWFNNSNVDSTPSVRVTYYVVTPNGSFASAGEGASYILTPNEADVWQFENISLTVPERCTYIMFDFFAGTGWTRYDDLSLTKAKTGVQFKDADGRAVTELSEDSTSYTAYVSYAAEDAESTARAYVAHYEKDATGDLTLIAIKALTLNASGMAEALTLDNVNVTKDTTVVKAFVWDANIGAAAATTIE